MKNIMKTISGLFILGSMALASCTDVESLSIHESNMIERNPEAYAKYLSNLVDYKAADHKVAYAWFDNSNKAPFSPGQHVTNMPDSLDVISMMTPELADFEKTDIATVRQKGTKVVYTVSYDDIKAVYDGRVLNGDTSLDPFDTYLKNELTSLLSYSADYDGLIVEFAGQNPTFMSSEELATYRTTQNVFLDAINTWKSSNSEKWLAFQGKPQNLLDKSILADCKHIILDYTTATTPEQLDLLVNDALETGVPTDRFVMAVSTVSVDTTDKKTGYWGETRALGEVAYWVTVEKGTYTKAGIAIYNVQNDYYSTGGACTYVKNAIDIMNPAPAK